MQLRDLAFVAVVVVQRFVEFHLKLIFLLLSQLGFLDVGVEVKELLLVAALDLTDVRLGKLDELLL